MLLLKNDNLLFKLLRVALTLGLINTARHFVPQVVFSVFLFLGSVAVNNVAGELPHLDFLTSPVHHFLAEKRFFETRLALSR